MTTSTAGKTGRAPAWCGHGVACWLAFAAAPTFLGMAWLAAGNATMPCSPLPGVLPVDGMTLMYLLMGLFHLTPWLKLVSRRATIACPPHRPDEGD